MSAYVQKSERSQINDLILQLKLLEKQEQAKPKTSRRREIIKLRAKINEIETKKKHTKFNEIKSWFFEKINKMDRPLAKLTKIRKGKEPKSLKSEMQRRDNNKHHGNHQRLL
jgi:hypothetical protein